MSFLAAVAPSTVAAATAATSPTAPGVKPMSKMEAIGNVAKAMKEDADSHPIPQLAPLDAGLQPMAPAETYNAPFITTSEMAQRYRPKPFTGFSI